MRVIAAEIEIEAPHSVIWEVLSDLASYPDWNPFLTSATGDVVEGARVEVFIKPPRARGTTINPQVVLVEEGRGFSWRSNMLFPGLFDTEHYFIIDPIDDDRCRFVQGEEITGLLVIPILCLIGGGTRRGFERMNEALKARCEALLAPPPDPGESSSCDVSEEQAGHGEISS